MTIAQRTKATGAVRERIMVKSKLPETVTEMLRDIVDNGNSKIPETLKKD